MTETLKDMMAARADAAPGPQIDIQDVVRDGRRRVWRHRAAGGTAACAVVAASALVVPSLSVGEDDETGIAGEGGFEKGRVTYAVGSTIHYGDREIDVSPHEPRSFVQTDDGFVFADEDEDDTVYFTNGEETAEIGHAGAFTQFFADDSGSYVAWVEVDDGELPETVVYDTRAGSEVLRTDEDNGPGPGYVSDYDDMPRIEGLDGETVYVRNADGVVAIELSTGEAGIVIPPESDDMLSDVANGQIARANEVSGLVVSADPDADAPRFPQLTGGDLSPRATYVVADGFYTRLRVIELDSRRVVSPTMPNGNWRGSSIWIDDDTFVRYDMYDKHGQPEDVVRSTTCSVSSGDCSAPNPVAAGRIRLPIGSDAYGS